MSRRREAILAGHLLTAIESRRAGRKGQGLSDAAAEEASSLDLRPAADRGDHVFFTRPEAAFVEAAIETLIPLDSAGPGALESGVLDFIDGRLATLSGRQSSDLGRAGDPSRHEYRSVWSAPALMRAGIADVDGHCLRTRGAIFAGLPRRERGAVLREVSHGEADLAITPNATFFRLLLQLTVEGYLGEDGDEGRQGRLSKAGSPSARAPSVNDASFGVTL
jgi:gluconate 2-dehydrogenase subunit 3-like protein